MLVGNLTAILVSAGVTLTYALWRPDDYDWWGTYHYHYRVLGLIIGCVASDPFIP